MATLKIDNKEVQGISIGGKDLASFTIGGKEFSFSTPPLAFDEDYFFAVGDTVYNGKGEVSYKFPSVVNYIHQENSGYYVVSAGDRIYRNDGHVWDFIPELVYPSDIDQILAFQLDRLITYTVTIIYTKVGSTDIWAYSTATNGNTGYNAKLGKLPDNGSVEGIRTYDRYSPDPAGFSIPNGNQEIKYFNVDGSLIEDYKPGKDVSGVVLDGENVWGLLDDGKTFETNKDTYTIDFGDNTKINKMDGGVSWGTLAGSKGYSLINNSGGTLTFGAIKPLPSGVTNIQPAASHEAGAFYNIGGKLGFTSDDNEGVWDNIDISDGQKIVIGI